MARIARNDPVQHERFARALADGGSTRRAAAAAGFSTTSGYPPKLAKKPEMRALVARIIDEKPFTDSDLAPVIAALMRGAEAAMKKDSAAAYSAAARMLAEAGRLKQKLPSQSAASRDLEMAWALRWGPPD